MCCLVTRKLCIKLDEKQTIDPDNINQLLTQSQTENVPPPTRPTTRLQSQTVGLLEPMFPDITFMMSGADDAISVLDLLGLELSGPGYPSKVRKKKQLGFHDVTFVGYLLAGPTRMVTGEQSKHNEENFLYFTNIRS